MRWSHRDPPPPFGWSPVGGGTQTGMSVQEAPRPPLARLAHLSRYSLRKLLAAPRGVPAMLRMVTPGTGPAEPAANGGRRPRNSAPRQFPAAATPGLALYRRHGFTVLAAGVGAQRLVRLDHTTALPDDLALEQRGFATPANFARRRRFADRVCRVVLLDAGAQPQPAPANQPDQKSGAGPVRRGSVTRRAR
jgi:hypothetical protein